MEGLPLLRVWVLASEQCTTPLRVLPLTLPTGSAPSNLFELDEMVEKLLTGPERWTRLDGLPHDSVISFLLGHPLVVYQNVRHAQDLPLPCSTLAAREHWHHIPFRVKIQHAKIVFFW